MNAFFQAIVHEEHVLVAAGLDFAADRLAAAAPTLQAGISAEIPAGSEALIALIEKDDAALGAGSVFVNALIDEHKADIEAELQKVLDQGFGPGGVPALVQAIHNVAAKVRAK